MRCVVMDFASWSLSYWKLGTASGFLHVAACVEQSSKYDVRKNSGSYTLNQKGQLKKQFQMLSPGCMVIPKLIARP